MECEFNANDCRKFYLLNKEIEKDDNTIRKCIFEASKNGKTSSTWIMNDKILNNIQIEYIYIQLLSKKFIVKKLFNRGDFIGFEISW